MPFRFVTFGFFSVRGFPTFFSLLLSTKADWFRAWESWKLGCVLGVSDYGYIFVCVFGFCFCKRFLWWFRFWCRRRFHRLFWFHRFRLFQAHVASVTGLLGGVHLRLTCQNKKVNACFRKIVLWMEYVSRIPLTTLKQIDQPPRGWLFFQNELCQNYLEKIL